MAITVILLISLFVGVITWWYSNLFKWKKYISIFPGPSPLPIIGNAHQLGSVTAVLPAALSFQEKFGNTFIVWFGPRPRLFTTDQRFLEFFLNSTVHIDKSYEYHFANNWIGTGLLLSSGEKWKRQRKRITPAFHFQILEQFIDTFDSQSTILMKRLQTQVGKGPFDIFPYISLCALDVICEAAMGTSVYAQLDSDSDYVHSVKEICKIIITRMLSPIKMWDSLYKFSKDYQDETKALNVIHGYTRSVINSRRKQLAKSKSNPVLDDNEEVGLKKRLAFLDLLLRSSINGQPFPDESIREEVDTFMFEGHDTVTSAISFTLYCLAKYPGVQQKVVEEQLRIFAVNKDRPITNSDIQNMKYLEMVIKESMRIYPPVPYIARELQQDVPFDGVVLPKGLVIAAFVYGLHNRKDIFLNPEKFDPERFSLDNISGRSVYAYLPFSAGPRNCIGQKFAMMETKAIISKIVRNFELLNVPKHKPQLSAEIILKSANGLLIDLKERKFEN